MRDVKGLAAFVAIGGFASAVNLLARIALDALTSYEAAIVLAFPFGLTTAFLLNRAFVFNRTQSSWTRQYWRFLLVNLATLVQIFLISVALARWVFPMLGMTWHAKTIAHAVGLLSPILTSYWAHKHFSFAPDARASTS